MSVPSGPLLIVERFDALVQGRGLWHVTGVSSPKSKKGNRGKRRCKASEPRLVIEGCPILTLRLRILRSLLLGHRSESSGSHAAGDAEVQIRRSSGAGLGQDAC